MPAGLDSTRRGRNGHLAVAARALYGHGGPVAPAPRRSDRHPAPSPPSGAKGRLPPELICGALIVFSTAQTILEYLQTFVWPVVVVGLVVLLVVRYHDQVVAFLDRLTGINVPGLGVNAAPPSQDVAAADPVIELDAFQAVVDDYEQQLQQAQHAHQQTAEELIQQGLTTRIELDCERGYRLIFGSQIRALRALSDALPTSVPRSLLEPIFEAAKSAQILALPEWWTFEQWVGFLLRQSVLGRPFVQQLGDGTYKLEDAGQAFLRYIDNNGFGPKNF